MQYSVSVIMPVGWVIALLLFVVLIALGLKILTGKKTSGADYLVRGAILTPAEISFLAVLETINYPGAKIYAKVRLADIFEVNRTASNNDTRGAFNRISAKHIDFLLVRNTDAAPILGFELDDKSHEKEHRKRRDVFVNDVFLKADLPLLRIAVRHSYNSRELSEQINKAIRERAKR